MDAKQTPLIELLERVPADASPDPLHLSRILHELAGAASLCWTPHPSGVFDSQKAIKCVESAIAEIRERQAQPEQEPVAWMVYTLDGKSVCVTDNPNDFSEEHRALAIYTTPPQRKPLTDERITQVIDSMPNKFAGFMIDWDLYEFTRVIEAAHGIKEKNT